MVSCFFLNKTGDSGIEATEPERLPFSYSHDMFNWCALTVRNRLGSMSPQGLVGSKSSLIFVNISFGSAGIISKSPWQQHRPLM